MIKARILLLCLSVATGAGCAGRTPDIPYPAFMETADIPDSFLAELPGARAKILSADPSSRSYSMLLQLPADYSFATGGAPDRTLELYVLQGSVTIGEFVLDSGGYAYLPSGTMGTGMKSAGGALLLYFIDTVKPDAIIQTPLIGDSDLLPWQSLSDSVDDFGLATKELRSDPGSGATTWLLKVEPGAIRPWQSASAELEGYLIRGQYRHSECVQGVPVTGDYAAGSYFRRPPGAVNGGPDAGAATTSVWFLRTPAHATLSRNLVCGVADAG